jgi:hypothetical protein
MKISGVYQIAMQGLSREILWKNLFGGLFNDTFGIETIKLWLYELLKPETKIIFPLSEPSLSSAHVRYFNGHNGNNAVSQIGYILFNKFTR